MEYTIWGCINMKGKKIVIASENYNYLFNQETGFTARWGVSYDDDPFMAPMPELADISINNKCDRGCSFCYRNSKPDGPDMPLEDYKNVLSEIPNTYQIALGGGEPTMHPDFIEILRSTKEDFGRVPNYTTSGAHLTDEIIEATKKYCGAVAVSYSDRDNIWVDAIKRFLKAKVRTNIHFVVSEKTAQTAINLLTDLEITPNLFGIEDLNAIVFLLYKPVGRAKEADMLTSETAVKFLEVAFNSEIKVGFDSCFAYHMKVAEELERIKVPWELIDSCESSRFSVYINEDMTVKPCSFAYGEKYATNLKDATFDEIWNGDKFNAFRKLLKKDAFVCHLLE